MAVRVLIVDDSAMMRSFLREVLSEDPAIEVVGVASEPSSARKKINLLKPDVITLDIAMPGMDGLTFLEQLMQAGPLPVVMVSSFSNAGAAATVRALELGAVDFVAKPSAAVDSGWSNFRADLISKVKVAAVAAIRRQVPVKRRQSLPGTGAANGRLVVLGGSTGSVSVLEHIIGAMPANGPAIVVAVHMPAQFTKQFAARLNGLCEMTVIEASDGLRIGDGHAYVAPGDRHLTIERSGAGYVCRLESGPRVNGFVPSIDVLFESVADAAGQHAVGVILTGMGKDGAAGLKAMYDAGAVTACQDKATSLIYGMPGSAVALGGVCHELPAPDISAFILRNCRAQISDKPAVVR